MLLYLDHRLASRETGGASCASTSPETAWHSVRGAIGRRGPEAVETCNSGGCWKMLFGRHGRIAKLRLESKDMHSADEGMIREGRSCVLDVVPTERAGQKNNETITRCHCLILKFKTHAICSYSYLALRICQQWPPSH